MPHPPQRTITRSGEGLYIKSTMHRAQPLMTIRVKPATPQQNGAKTTQRMPMPSGPDFMRPLRATEEDAADALLRAAFKGPAEATLVRALRAAGMMDLEMVLPWQNGLAGYLALSRLTAPEPWLALAPVAIAPEWQNQRWGSRLVAGVVKLTAIKGQTVVVHGKPSFYSRAGFDLGRAARLRSRYPLAQTLLCGPGSDDPECDLIYPPAFNAL
jgi:putative acetyltransferase